MTSELTNGAKSHVPKTDEGLETSSRNSLKQNPEQFQEMLEPVSPAPIQPEPARQVEEAPPSNHKKSPNEPTPPTPVTVRKQSQPLSIVGHRTFRPWGGRSCRLPRRAMGGQCYAR